MAYFEHYPLQYKLLSMSSTADHRLSVKVVCYDSICVFEIHFIISKLYNYSQSHLTHKHIIYGGWSSMQKVFKFNTPSFQSS